MVNFLFGLILFTVVPTDLEQNMVNNVNHSRKVAGLHELVIDPVLMVSTRQHAERMANNCSMYHMSGPWRENIAYGQSNSKSVHNTWMNSSGHHANIMSNCKKIGVAGYVNSNGTIYWCMRVSN